MNGEFPPPQDAPPAPEARPVSVRVELPQGVPWATYTLIAVTVFVYLLQVLSQLLLGEDLPVMLGVKYAPLVASGQVWRLVTPVFLHGSLLHIGFNMYALYILGPALERFMGRRRFLLLYFLGGVGGNVFSLWMSPAPSLGASTAIFGLIAAEAIFIYRNRFLFADFQKALSNVLWIAGVNFVIGLSPGIDNWGHLGGFLAGGAFTWFAGPLFQVAGAPPLLHLTDTRPAPHIWRTAALVGAVLVLLTAVWLRMALR